MLVRELIIFKAEDLLSYFLREIAREKGTVEARQRKFYRVKSSQTRYRRGLLTLDYRPFCTTDPVTPRGSYVCTCVTPLNFLSEYGKKSRTPGEIEAFLRSQENHVHEAWHGQSGADGSGERT